MNSCSTLQNCNKTLQVFKKLLVSRLSDKEIKRINFLKQNPNFINPFDADDDEIFLAENLFKSKKSPKAVKKSPKVVKKSAKKSVKSLKKKTTK